MKPLITVWLITMLLVMVLIKFATAQSSAYIFTPIAKKLASCRRAMRHFASVSLAARGSTSRECAVRQQRRSLSMPSRPSAPPRTTGRSFAPGSDHVPYSWGQLERSRRRCPLYGFQRGWWAIFRTSGGTLQTVVTSRQPSPLAGRFFAVVGDSLNNREEKKT